MPSSSSLLCCGVSLSGAICAICRRLNLCALATCPTRPHACAPRMTRSLISSMLCSRCCNLRCSGIQCVVLCCVVFVSCGATLSCFSLTNASFVQRWSVTRHARQHLPHACSPHLPLKCSSRIAKASLLLTMKNKHNVWHTSTIVSDGASPLGFLFCFSSASHSCALSNYLHRALVCGVRCCAPAPPRFLLLLALRSK